jgi:hypothetical protein
VQSNRVKNLMDTGELLGNLRRDLEIPESGAVPLASHNPAIRDQEVWYRLRRAIRELEEGAGRVGELPRDYPMHLSLVMRAIHALLPWYTRPLRQHAEHTVAVVKAMEAILERLDVERSERPTSPAQPPQ